LRMLLGSQRASIDSRSPTSRDWDAATRQPQMPHGHIVDKIKKQMEVQTEADFRDNPQPVKDVLDYIATKHSIPIQIHPDVEELATTALFRFTLRDAPLLSVFQAIEDGTNGNVQFVLRDYGILLASRSAAARNGFMPLLDFCRDPGAANTESARAMP